MKSYLDTISLLETGDIELIQSLQSLGYGEDAHFPALDIKSKKQTSLPRRNKHLYLSGTKGESI